MFDLFVDSFSRCFGISSSKHRNSSDSLGGQPFRASRLDNDQSEGNSQPTNVLPEQVHSNNQNLRSREGEWDGPMKVCCSPAIPKESRLSDTEMEHDVLARARRQASVSTGRRRFKSSGPISVSSSSSLSMEKLRTKSNKRKLDIFRTNSDDSKKSGNSSFASRFLGDSSFATGAILCFANPIIDEEDEAVQIHRVSNACEDDETVTSTLYFDAKYEHIIEDQPPQPLYTEFAVTSPMSIAQIFKTGSHKTIKSIQYCQQSPPRPPATARLANNEGAITTGADNTISLYSSSDDSSDDDEVAQQDEVNTNKLKADISGGDNSFDTISKTEYHFSNHSGEQEHPALKLASKSSLSTAALTPVCSSRSSTSLSPQTKRLNTNMIEKNLESIQTMPSPLI